jgi:hypothetical protein
MDRKETRKLTGCLFIFFGISFVATSIGVVLALVFGQSLTLFFTDEDGDNHFGWYKTQFWIGLISFILFLFAGGKIKNLEFLMIFLTKRMRNKKTCLI